MNVLNWQKSVPLMLLLCAANYCGAQTTQTAQNAQSIAEPGDPARWYQHDTTQHDYANTLKKEAQAAYLEAQKECRSGDAASRQTCLKQAREQFNSDLADAKSQDTKSAR
jgi:Skp family chaperone for outer membrane proteins